jgi:predicted nucleic acid-binding protein
MIVVADSGPLHYLILIEQIGLLRRFYDEVAVPEAVADELRAGGAPAVVRRWIARPPDWVAVTRVPQEQIESVTKDLDFGERAAIALAATIRADLLLIDDAAGRMEAARRNLRVTGTLGGFARLPNRVSSMFRTCSRSSRPPASTSTMIFSTQYSDAGCRRSRYNASQRLGRIRSAERAVPTH